MFDIPNGIRRILNRRSHQADRPEGKIDRLGTHLARTGMHGALTLCRCGGILTPVLFRNSGLIEVRGIACLDCCNELSVCSGVIVPSAPQAVEG